MADSTTTFSSGAVVSDNGVNPATGLTTYNVVLSDGFTFTADNTTLQTKLQSVASGSYGGTPMSAADIADANTILGAISIVLAGSSEPAAPVVIPESPSSTDQQNNASQASGAADDDSGDTSSQNNQDGTWSAQTAQARGDWTSTSAGAQSIAQSLQNSSTVNAGSTIAGKSGTSTTPSANQPGRRLNNPLGNFSSYNYQITLYIVTPAAYNAFVMSGRTNINALSNNNVSNPNYANSAEGTYIVVQSGGINNTTSSRAPGIKYDLYIDNLEIKSVVSGKSDESAGGPTNTVEMSFQITEPYGFSFITQLKRAWNTIMAGIAGPTGATASDAQTQTYLKDLALQQTYVLGIRFLGYDAAGNVVTGQQQLAGSTVSSPTSTPTNGSFETFYDIHINDMKFKLDGRPVTYSCTATGQSSLIGKGLVGGRLISDTTLSGSTVGDMLTALTSKLNSDQLIAQKGKTLSIPNVYKVTYIGPDADLIQNSSVVNKQVDSDKQKYPMQLTKPDSTITTADSINPAVNGNERQLGFKGGESTSIIQVIQTIVTQSNFIQNSISDLFTNDLNPNPSTSDNYPTATNNSNKVLKWINVSTEVLNLGYDNIRHDFAWQINYIIQSYNTPVAPIPQAKNIAPYYGPVKRYEYWFTGKNTEVLRFEMEYNNLYHNLLIGDGTDQKNVTTPIPTMIGKAPAPKQGMVGGEALESQSSYINYLSDPGALSSAKLSILGDPDWLLQDNASSINTVFNQYYGSNGFTINCNGGQVFIEVDFKEAVDYDNTIGVMSVNDKLVFWDYPAEYKTGPNAIKGISFTVNQVTSNFRGGKFEQTLGLVANFWPISTTGATTPGAREPLPATGAVAGQSTLTATTDPRSTLYQGGIATNGQNNAGSPTAGFTPAPATPTPTSQSAAADSNSNSNATTLSNATQTAPTQVTEPTNNPNTPQVASDDAASQNTTSNPTYADGSTEADQRNEYPYP